MRFFKFAVETSAGSLSPRTNWSSLANFEFDLPPLSLQRRIAEILWAEDTSLEEWHATVDAVAKKRKATVQRGVQLIVLLAGGSKRTQRADIKRAKALAALLD